MQTLKTWLLVGFLASLGAPTVHAKKAASKSPVVVLHTNHGKIHIKLDPVKAPESVKNFIEYAKSGFYSGTTFHRVIPGFMIQGGGFTEKMQRKNTRPPIKNEAANGLRNKRGTISMARTSVVDSATSQFFINLIDNAPLDHRSASPGGFGYAVFGQVTKGMDIVDKIAVVPTCPRSPGCGPLPPGMRDVPVKPVIIKKAEVKG